MSEGGGGEAGASLKVIFVHKRQPPMFDDMDIPEGAGSDVEMSGSENTGSDMEMLESDVDMEVSVIANWHGHDTSSGNVFVATAANHVIVVINVLAAKC